MSQHVDSTVASPRFMRRSSLARKLSCDADLPAEIIDSLWQGDVEQLLFSATPLQVKDRCIVARYDHPAGPLLIKRHTWGGLSRTLRSGWRAPAARRCAQLGLFLVEHGVPTPRPRACLEERIGPFGYCSYLLTDYVEGTSLYRFIRFSSPAKEVLEYLARQTAGIWQQLVDLGVSHSDLKPENFIIDPSLTVWLIDLEKVRQDRNGQRLRERQRADVDNFLHVRGWHGQVLARNIFRGEFLHTASGEWLRSEWTARNARHPQRELMADVDPCLSVLVLCDEGRIDLTATQAAIESVRDIADEAVLVAPCPPGGRVEILQRTELCSSSADAVEKSKSRAENQVDSNVAWCPWVLVLHQHECVTPILTKRLQEQISSQAETDAFRIPIETHFFGRQLALRSQMGRPPIRLFHQARCSFSLANGLLTISADPERTGQIDGTIQQSVCATVAEFVERLNLQTTRAAEERLRGGERSQLMRRLFQSAGQFLWSYFADGGLFGGWAGLQLHLLEATFSWLEEAKLWQMRTEFRNMEAPPVAEQVHAEFNSRPAHIAPLPQHDLDETAAKAA